MKLAQRAKRFCDKLLTSYRAEHAHRVAQLVFGSDEEVIAAAYLHDILEDTNTTERTIRKEFGVKVARMVKALTNPPSVYMAEVRDFSHLKDASLEVKKIKLADRIDNIKKRVYDDYQHVMGNKYAEETERLLDVIKDGDAYLAGILNNLIIKLKNNYAKYHDPYPTTF